VLTILAFLMVTEILARRNPDASDAIRFWANMSLVIWIVAARLGFVLTHWDAFAPDPWTVLAIWQGGFNIWAGTFGLGVTLVAAFIRHPRAGGPVLTGVATASRIFGVATFLLPDETRGRIPAAGFADLTGAPISLAQRDGRPLVLNIWATWCPPCRREMPMMVDVAGSQSDVDVVFANQGEPERTIMEFLDLTELSTDGMVRDPNNALMQEFSLQGLPSTLFFAADGSLKAVHTGEISRTALMAGIEDLKRIDLSDHGAC
jgi:thiol-disulfide isomerase/thioredoxin